MPDLVDVAVTLVDIFHRLQIRFALGGAMANNYWGIVRATLDVDCLISLPAIKYQVLADELTAAGCSLRDDSDRSVPITVLQMREQAEERKLLQLSLNSADVELFLPAVALQEEILRRAIPVQVRGRTIYLTTPEDLILLKLVFHRPKDLQDIRGILWVQRRKLDRDYMKQWSARTHEAEVQQELDQLIAEYAARD